MIATVFLYWNTARYLKPRQITARVGRYLRRARVNLRPAPPRRARVHAWAIPAARRSSVVGPATVVFLNSRANIADVGWDNPAFDKLWRYNLHYFDDLNSERAHERRAWHEDLVRQWLRANPPGAGTGWEPYPTSVRIVNWVKWALAGNDLSADAVHSLAVQTRWLASRLETHLLGNHLLQNGKALMFAGAFFEGTEADGWLARGRGILDREIPEQILPDGGHFELSVMYHALALEDMLDLCNVAATYGLDCSSGVRETIDLALDAVSRMQSWLETMTHPDGEIAFFNDGAFGVAPPPAELHAYAERVGFRRPPRTLEPLTSHVCSGYIRVEGHGAVALLDVARVGPDYLPGHAHADTLCFELSLYGQRLFVNSGTSVYGNGAERARQRGTAAHNTVVINGENSSEVWGGFRVARRAYPLEVSTRTGEVIEVACAHDGYRRLPGRPEHKRIWSFQGKALTVTDLITGTWRSAEARLHLHPSVTVSSLNERQAQLRLPGGQEVALQVEGAFLAAAGSMWHPEFGLDIPSTCITARVYGAELRTVITW